GLKLVQDKIINFAIQRALLSFGKLLLYTQNLFP
ncbi:MAG: hypothetical protein ACJAZR_001996, partial [Sediminicola sp.]